MTRARCAAIAFAIVCAAAGPARADVLGSIRGALDRTGAFLDRTLGVDGGAAPGRRVGPNAAALIEESPAPAASPAARATAAARLRDGLDALDRATTPAERAAAAGLVVDAAERGDPDAQYLLGGGDLLLPAGERDAPRAARWLARAAVQGHARAQYALARAYVDGDGVTRDAAWANLWFERAARRGHHLAQHTLALREIAGEGNPADHADAYRWLAIAVAAGNADSKRYRDALGGRLTPAQRLGLDAEAAAFRPVAGSEPWPDPPMMRYVQQALGARGFDPGPADGESNPRTRAALARYAGGGDGALTPALVARLRAG